MSLLSRLPLMPLYYNGNTKFSPIHVTDLVDIIFDMVELKYTNLILECVGPEEFTLRRYCKTIKIYWKKKNIVSHTLSFSKIVCKDTATTTQTSSY